MAGPGSIAFTGLNADDPDSLAFAALEDLAAGTVITLDDNEWNGTAFNTGEGTLTITLTTAVTAGTIIRIEASNTATPTISTGTISRLNSFDISGTTESVYAYVGSGASPTFLSAIGISGFTGATTTGLLTNTGLTLGVDAIDIGTVDAGADIAAYNGARTGQLSFAGYRTLINTVSNWVTQDAAGSQAGDGTNPDTPFSADPFVISGGQVNDTPVVTVAASLAATEQVASTIDATATISDADLDALNGGNGDYAGATLGIANNGGADANDLFAIGTSGAFTVNGSTLEAGGLAFATFSGGNGSQLNIIFTSSDTPATTALVNAVLQSVRYTYTGDEPPADGVDVAIFLNDGAPANAGQGSTAGHPAVGIDVIHVSIVDTPENAAPVLDLDSVAAGTDTTATLQEGQSVQVAPAALLTDPDSANFDGGSLTVSYGAGVTDDDYLTAQDQGGQFANNGRIGINLTDVYYSTVLIGTISSQGAGQPYVVTFNSSATPQAVQQLVQTIYTGTTSDTPPSGARTLTFTITDGDGDGGSVSAAASVTITAVDDEPTLSATGASTTLTENGAAVDLFSAVVASAVEAGQSFTSLTFTVSGVLDGANEIIRVDGSNVALTDGNGVTTATNGLTANVSAAGGVATVTFSGASLNAAQLQTLIGGLTYVDTGENPTDGDRVITLTQLIDSGANTTPDDNMAALSVSATVNVNPVDDAPVANDDAGSTAENAIGTGSLFDNDSDVDGGPKTVTEVNGVSGNVGTQFALASGALLTVNADGTYSYDPNGQFNALNANGDTSNQTAIETFSYTLNGGDTATVTVTINGVQSPDDRLVGSGGNDVIDGTALSDLFMLADGGDEDVDGGASDDGFYFGTQLTAADNVDGGDGALDQVGLQGDVTLTLGAANLVNVEMLVLMAGDDTRFGDTAGNFYDYNITTVDENVGQGEQLIVSFNRLRAGEDVVFDGSAETDGHFLTYGGAGNDHLTGGQQNDGFYFAAGNWNAGDTIDGGAGTQDQLGLQGNFPNIAFGAGQLTGIETVVVISAQDTRFSGGAVEYDYALRMDDGNLDTGQTLAISGNRLTGEESLVLDASAETDGTYLVYGGAGNDVITGGGGDDVIMGGLRGDTLTGRGGNDIFRYDSVGDSNSTERDGIQDFNIGDRFDLSRIDANAGLAGDQAFNFIGNAAFSGTAGELRFENISLGGPIWLVAGDTDGDATSDFEVVLVIIISDPITSTDFIL